ncbi:MAG: DUF6364 family protein [Bacteroidota bacterium]
MDAKITMSFNQDVIETAKEFAYKNGISLSRLTEILLHKVTSGGYKTLEDLPISDWVNNLVAEEGAVYNTKRNSRKDLKDEFFESRK